MQIHVFDTAEQAGKATAMLFAAQLINKPDSVLGLATGSTPIPTYQNLVAMYKEGLVDFSKATSFNLDEYVGISEDHPCSYHAFMQAELFDHVNANPANVHVPNGNAKDGNQEGKEYDAAIKAAGGIDMQLLGIGRNAHIGFNEPDDHFVYGCHVEDLTPSTIEANRRFFNAEEEVPHQAISMGVGGIMNAKKIVLVATGADKAEAMYKAIHGDITPQVPASILRAHPDVVFILDKAAAGLL